MVPLLLSQVVVLCSLVLRSSADETALHSHSPSFDDITSLNPELFHVDDDAHSHIDSSSESLLNQLSSLPSSTPSVLSSTVPLSELPPGTHYIVSSGHHAYSGSRSNFLDEPKSLHSSSSSDPLFQNILEERDRLRRKAHLISKQKIAITSANTSLKHLASLIHKNEAILKRNQDELVTERDHLVSMVKQYADHIAHLASKYTEVTSTETKAPEEAQKPAAAGAAKKPAAAGAAEKPAAAGAAKKPAAAGAAKKPAVAGAAKKPAAAGAAKKPAAAKK